MSDADKIFAGMVKECREVEQTLGRALGYPWFKDDQKNFPGTTEADGVCIGDHVTGTIAAEAASRLSALESALSELVSIVEIHSKATGNNFAWAELIDARKLLVGVKR